MAESERLEKQSSIAYIETLQSIINRMASNSASCKTWAITLVAAIIALANIDQATKVYVCEGIVGVFFLLDCYYLGLERRFIEIQNEFVKNQDSDPFKIPHTDACEQLARMICAIPSLSTTPVYGIMALLIYFLLNK